jgi:hypothetical protein
VNLHREPAVLYISLLAPVVQAVAAFILADAPITQGIVNTAAVAVAGAITAFVVRSENLLPALTGAAQALIALVVALGLHWTTAQQAALMIPIGIIAGFVVRDRVVAPVPAVTPAAPPAVV